MSKVKQKDNPYTGPTAITKEEINELPLTRYTGPITIVQDTSTTTKLVKELMNEKVLGFDTESKPTFKKGQHSKPSLIQLATKDQVYLFQLSASKTIEPLLPLFSSAKPLKVGIALHDDIKSLQKMMNFEPKGFVNVSDYVSRFNITTTGLRSLAALFLKIRISKGAQVSNWARKTLSDNQIKYAATDAWVSRNIYLKIKAIANSGKRS